MATPRPAPPLSGIRRAVKRALFASGSYRRKFSQLEFPGAAVLCYHSIRGDEQAALPFNELHVARSTFEQHCRLIAEHCHPISLADLRDARSGARPLPPRAVLVTFDDGYRAVLDLALPVLERYRIPAVVFTCSGPVTRGMHFWFDSVCRTVGESAVLDGRSAPVSAWKALVTANETAAAASDQHRPLTVDELKRLAASPLIEIGGHTVSHPTLALMSHEDQQQEIAGCRGALRQIIGAPIDAFAYPYGVSTLDYSADTVCLVQRAGFSLGFTTGQSFAGVDCNAYEIPRFVMLDSIDEVELAHRLSYSWHA
jgi:peptidoglycan/xylan/chitin deacetylase (PgdA/CDA1 family)